MKCEKDKKTIISKAKEVKSRLERYEATQGK
jgi:hypothetical protein